MNKQLYIKLSLLLVVVLLPNPVLAVNNQNLDWGIEVGDTYQYTYTEIIPSDDLFTTVIERNYEFNITVVGLPFLHDDIDERTDFEPRLNTHYEIETDDTLPTRIRQIWTAYPVGNWPVITSIENSTQRLYYDNATFSETPSDWSVTWVYDALFFEEVFILKISKSSGVLNQALVERKNKQTGVGLSAEIRNNDLPASPDVWDYVGWGIILGSIGIIAVVSILLYRARKEGRWRNITEDKSNIRETDVLFD
ncbi:MAG: hypothetical protein RTU30_16490 [Candidatus Thorarchaeota archaeon]